MKKRLGFIVNNLTVGGVSTVLINLCNSLVSSSYEIHLIILSQDIEMEEILPINKEVIKHYINYNFDDNYSLKSYLINSIFLDLTKKKSTEVLMLIKQLKLDILHLHTLPKQLTIGILAKRENPNLELVFTDHVLRIGELDYNFYQRILLGFAYKILYNKYHLIAVSKSVANYINNFNLHNPKLVFQTLENSIDFSKYKIEKQEQLGEREVLIYIARINENKGQKTLIQSWKLCNKHKEDLLYLVGPDETNGQIPSLAENDPSIILTGSTSDIQSLLRKATIGIYPSQKEGLPISLLEMMAFELPIIVSDIPELTSVIRNDQEGLHFKLDDEVDLKNKIESLLRNRIKREFLGKKARKRAEEIAKENDPVTFHNKFYNQIIS